MKLSKKAVSLLKRIIRTQDCSMKLTPFIAKSAQELVDSKLAEFIPLSQGGAEVALTTAGVHEAEGRQLGMDEEKS